MVTTAAGEDRILDRRKVVARLLRDRSDMVVISGLGSPSYDVHAAGDHDGNFYLWGAMGGAAMMGLGLALARPDRDILVITGDGEQLMGLGGLATIGARNPANLCVVVLDNGHFGETGMQVSHTSLGTDLAAVARSCGFARSNRIVKPNEIEEFASHPFSHLGASFASVQVKADSPARSLPPLDGVMLRDRLRKFLGSQPG
jgi:thiamine pyrophosphate-dependent acetolactate synthase large subunit-like protein